MDLFWGASDFIDVKDRISLNKLNTSHCTFNTFIDTSLYFYYVDIYAKNKEENCNVYLH